MKNGLYPVPPPSKGFQTVERPDVVPSFCLQGLVTILLVYELLVERFLFSRLDIVNG